MVHFMLLIFEDVKGIPFPGKSKEIVIVSLTDPPGME